MALALLLLGGCQKQAARPGEGPAGAGPGSSASTKPAISVEIVRDLLARGENADAIAMLSALERNGDSSLGRVRSLRAAALLSIRDRDAAATAARAAVEAFAAAADEKKVNADLARAWCVLAECNLASYRLDDARADLHAAEQATPEDDPVGRARVDRIRAEVALTSGDTSAAEAAAESSIRILTNANLGEHSAMGAAIATRATVWQRVMDKVNQTPDEFARAARILLGSRAADDPELVETLEKAVNLLEGRRRFSDADALADAWMRTAERRPGARRPWAEEAARCRRAHGLVRQGKLDDALGALNAVISVAAADSAEARVARVVSLAELADVHRRLKHFAVAHEVAEQALAVFGGQVARADEIEAEAYAKTILGWIMIDEGDFLAAEPVLVEAVDAQRRSAGEMNWKTGLARALLGETRMRQGRFDEAEEDMAYGSRILITYRGPDADAYRAIRLTAELYEAWGKPELASFYRERLPFTENSPASPD